MSYGRKGELVMKGCRAYSVDEYQTLLKVSDPRERCLISLGVRTGFRISELLSLNVEDVLGEYIVLKKCNTKGKLEGRVVPKHPECIPYIERYLAGRTSGPLFLNRYGERLKRIAAWQALCEMHTRASIRERVSTHSMRKTFCKNLYEKLDKNLLKLQLATGHKSIDSLVKYLAVDEGEIFDAIRKVK